MARPGPPGAHEVSVTLMEGDRARTVAFTGDLAVPAFDQAAVELAQQFAGFGTVALVDAALVDSEAAPATQLERAMASRR